MKRAVKMINGIEWEFEPVSISHGHGYAYVLPGGHIRLMIMFQLLFERRWYHTLKWAQCILHGHCRDEELCYTHGYNQQMGAKFRGYFCTRCYQFVLCTQSGTACIERVVHVESKRYKG